MKRTVIALALCCLTLSLSGHAQQQQEQQPPTQPQAEQPALPQGQPQCDLQLWRHVYRTSRFSIVKSCVAVTGTVQSVKPESDGDLLVRLKPDPQFKSMLNARNRTAQGGALVVKPVCTHPTTLADAKVPCQNFHQDFSDLKSGNHVSVTGALVIDRENDRGWREIHPVTSVTLQ